MAPTGPASAFESETFGQDASFRLEQPVGSMSISPSGRDVVLASKEGLHIIDLDSPYSPPRYLPHRTPWEVADVQWSPFAVRDFWVVSTSNQKALVWNLEAKHWQDNIEFVLHGHTRAITDINFSAHNPDILATCAVDSFVHCWDLRTPLRPAFSFSDWFAGATQVKWSRQDEHVVASSHDKFLHIWDERNGAYPVRTIEAHGTKIYGLDWNRFHPRKLVTCSLDKTIKFWDSESPEDVPERVIQTPFPVWRARHTPFGWGLLVMPQRGNSDLHLYDRRPIDGMLKSGAVRPVATFPGHEGQVKEFLWRARGTIIDGIDHRDFQLVSWGTDRELRLHRIDPEVYADIGYEKGISKTQRLHFTRRGAKYRTFRDGPEDVSSPLTSTPRGDSFPRQNQFLHFRQRTSTTIGMSKVPLSQFRGWVQGGGRTSRHGMHGRGYNRQNTDPITWLKNVKISSWDPDTIAEEIRQVGEKFKKVEFENVDIRHRKAVMSLQAPWGENQTQVYLRVDMRFPKLYPRGANAVLALQKSAGLDEASHKILATEIKTISETYASRKRGCLEAVLRYLLREQTMEQIVSWVLGEPLTDSKILETTALAGEESSSDDDDQIDGPRATLDASANIRVPLAKGCGALWSETGTLVCFFPAKPREPASFLTSLGVKDLEDSQSSRVFEGFGRLHPDSPVRKGANGVKTVDDDSSSETSDSSWNSSSSSSSSFETAENVRAGLPYHTAIPALPQRSHSLDHSNRSTTMGGHKLVEAPRLSVLSLHNFDDLLPAKKDLAIRYQILGNGPEVCRHNARVARNASMEDLACVWTLVGLILDDSVPLDIIPQAKEDTSSDILVIARSALSGRRKRDSGVDLSHDRIHELHAFGKTRWGGHPLGPTYLVPAIFDHFERLGDVQMLAMLSCLFTINPGLDHPPRTPLSGDPHAGADRSLAAVAANYFPSRFVAQASLRDEATAEGYVLVDAMSDHPPVTLQGARHGDARGGPGRSATTSSANTWPRKDSQTSSRAPSVVTDDAGEHHSTYSGAVSISASPEGSRLGQRTNSGLAYPSARASLSALTQSYSHSPPVHIAAGGAASSLKKFSPSGSLTPGWVASGIFGGHGGKAPRSSFHPGEAVAQDSRGTHLPSSTLSVSLRNSHKDGIITPEVSRRSLRSVAASDASERTRRHGLPVEHRKLKTHLHNQDTFDLDGYPSVPLLDPRYGWKYKSFRACYAKLLDIWQLHVQRAEIMKCDGWAEEVPPAYQTAMCHGQQPNHHANLVPRARRRTLTSVGRPSSPCLQIRRCCRRCGDALDPIEKNGVPIGWQCVNASCTAESVKAPKRSNCAICYRSIDGLAVPCFQCRHMTCYECAQDWFGPPRSVRRRPSRFRRSGSKDGAENEDKSTTTNVPDEDAADSDSSTIIDPDHHQTCPTGCGCPCPSLASISAPSQPRLDDAEPGHLAHQPSHTSTNAAAATADTDTTTHRSELDHGPDTAIGAFLALTRTRSKPGTAARVPSILEPEREHQSDTVGTRATEERESAIEQHENDHNANGNATSDVEDLLEPLASSKISSLRRSIGPGLSHGLTTRASDATIRKAK